MNYLTEENLDLLQYTVESLCTAQGYSPVPTKFHTEIVMRAAVVLNEAMRKVLEVTSENQGLSGENTGGTRNSHDNKGTRRRTKHIQKSNGES